jgi:hypothetical protein
MAISARGIRIDIGCLHASREGKEVLRLLFGNLKASARPVMLIRSALM